MRGKHVNVFSSMESLIKRKAFCVFMAVMLLFLMVPSGLVFANSLDSNQKSQTSDVEKEATEAQEISEESLPVPEDVSAEVSEKTKESSSEQEVVNVPSNTFNVTGSIKEAGGGPISQADNPYVFVAG